MPTNPTQEEAAHTAPWPEAGSSLDASTGHGLTDRGEKARARLLSEAERIFAEKGFAKASTREICAAAGLNAAAISYHFGGKEELYRAVLLGPIEAITREFAGFDDPDLSLADALSRIFSPFVLGAAADQCGVRLHLRELIEPSSVYAQTVGQSIKPQHDMMARLLAKHIGLAQPDDDVHRLVFAIIAMAHDYCMSQEFMKIVAPRLLSGPDALPRALNRMVEWGVALVEHEQRRHAQPDSPV